MKLYVWPDLLTIGLLVVLEGVLSADNALVLAILVRHLPESKQKKALLYGLGGAFVFRFLAFLLAKWILQIWWLQGAGALYLAYMAIDHFTASHEEKERRRTSEGRGFWTTVALVEFTDMAFAVDSIMVAVALSNKLWVVYTGAILGTIAMRVAAGWVVHLLNRYPQLEAVAYVLIGWTAVKLSCATYDNFQVAVRGLAPGAPTMPEWLFWSVLAILLVAGSLIAFRRPAKAAAAGQPEPERTLSER